MNSMACTVLIWIGSMMVIIGAFVPCASVSPPTRHNLYVERNQGEVGQRSVLGVLLPGHRVDANLRDYSILGGPVVFLSLASAIAMSGAKRYDLVSMLLSGYGLLDVGLMTLVLITTPHVSVSLGSYFGIGGFAVQLAAQLLHTPGNIPL